MKKMFLLLFKKKKKTDEKQRQQTNYLNVSKFIPAFLVTTIIEVALFLTFSTCKSSYYCSDA